jgi:hypothetical protein
VRILQPRCVDRCNSTDGFRVYVFLDELLTAGARRPGFSWEQSESWVVILFGHRLPDPEFVMVRRLAHLLALPLLAAVLVATPTRLPAQQAGGCWEGRIPTLD